MSLIKRINPTLPKLRLQDVSASHVFNGQVYGMKKQTDGKILIYGAFTQYNGNTRNRLVRLNADLTEDTTFATNLGSGFNGVVRDIALRYTGTDRMMVVGDFTNFNGNTRNYVNVIAYDGFEYGSFYANNGGSLCALGHVETRADESFVVASVNGGDLIHQQTDLTSNDTKAYTLASIDGSGYWANVASGWGSRKNGDYTTGGEWLNTGTIHDMYIDSSDFIHVVCSASNLVQHTGGGSISTVATVKYCVFNSNGVYQRYITSSNVTGDIFKLIQGQASEIILEGDFTAIADGTSSFTSQKGLASVQIGSGTGFSLLKSSPSSSIVGSGVATTTRIFKGSFRDTANARTILFHHALNAGADEATKSNILYLTDNGGSSLVSDDIKPIQMDYGLSKGTSTVATEISGMVDVGPYLLVSLSTSGVIGTMKWGKAAQIALAGAASGNAVLFKIYYK